MGREFLKANQLRSTFLSEGAGDARKLGSAARRRNIGAVCTSLKASARKKLEGVPELWIFNRRDHGGLLQITGQPGKAVQYDIGNPLTASRITQHQLPAAQRLVVGGRASAMGREFLKANQDYQYSAASALCQPVTSLA